MNADSLLAPTVGECVDLYLAHAAVRFGPTSTHALKLRLYLTAFKAMFGDQDAEAGKRSDLARLLLAHPEWESPHTKANALRSVVTCFNWCADEEFIEQHRYRTRRGMIPALRPRRHMTADEFRALMLAIRLDKHRISKRPFKSIMLFLWLTGARTCEARSVCWEHVDWEAGVIRLAEHKTAAASGGMDRLIPLNRHVCRLLNWIARQPARSRPASWVAWRTDRPGWVVRWYDRGRHIAWKGFGNAHDSQAHAQKFKAQLDAQLCPPPRQRKGLIFLNCRGNEWEKGNFNKLFRHYAKRAGIDPAVSPYSLRQGWCVRAIEAGVPTRAIADVLGHTTSKYVDWYGRGTRNNVAHLQAVLNRVHGKGAARG